MIQTIEIPLQIETKKTQKVRISIYFLENPTIKSSFCWAPSTFTIRKLVSSEAVAKKPFDPTIGSSKKHGQVGTQLDEKQHEESDNIPKNHEENIMFIMKCTN